MSRVGATATRALAGAQQVMADLAREGLDAVALAEFQREEDERVEKAKRRLVALLVPIVGPLSTEPDVIEDFGERYYPHERVCLKVRGHLFNYSGPGYKRNEGIYEVLGSCSRCAEVPFLRRVTTRADIGRNMSRVVQAAAERFVCGTCAESKA